MLDDYAPDEFLSDFPFFDKMLKVRLKEPDCYLSSVEQSLLDIIH